MPFSPPPVSLRLESTKLKSPVLADPLNGRVYQLDRSQREEATWTFDHFLLTNHPLLLTDRAVVG